MKLYFQDEHFTLYNADVKTFPFEELSDVQMIMTSPPYWGLRDYQVDGQTGLEPSPEEFCEVLCGILSNARKAMNKDGTMWINLMDTYIGQPAGNKNPTGFQQKHSAKVGINYNAKNSAGDTGSHGKTGENSRRSREMLPKQRLPNKCLAMVPARFAIMMCDKHDFVLRNEIIWQKPNAVPTPAKDRFTVAHENIYLFSMKRMYKFNQQKEETEDGKGTRNMRGVFTLPQVGYKGAHFATYNPKLITTPILAGTDKGDVVLDPFMGSGTTAVTAVNLGRKAIGIDINEEYCEIAVNRYKEETSQAQML